MGKESVPLRTVEIIITNANGKQIKHQFPIVSELSIIQKEDDFLDSMERYFSPNSNKEVPEGRSLNIEMKLRAHISEEDGHIIQTLHTQVSEDN